MDAFKRKFISIILISLFTIVQALSQGQYLSKTIYIKPGSTRLDSLLFSITQQTGVVFSYNSKKMNVARKIFIDSRTKNVGQFLEVLKREPGFAIKVIENYVVITSLSEPVQRGNSSNQLNSPLSSVAGKINNNSTSIQKNEKTHKPDIPLISSDSLQENEPVTPPEVVRNNEIQNISNDSLEQEEPRITQNQIDSTAKNVTAFEINLAPDSLNEGHEKSVDLNATPTPHISIRKNLFLTAGPTFDESSFMGVIVQWGLPIVFATASVNTNRLATHFRYGIGLGVKINSSIRLQVSVNNGNVSRSGFFTDSLEIRHPIEVKSQLFRAGLGIEIKLNRKFTLQAISNFNSLNTTYFINHLPSDLRQFKTAGDKLFYTILPPYLLSNSFSPDSDSNVKKWIGLQLNFLYRINFN